MPHALYRSAEESDALALARIRAKESGARRAHWRSRISWYMACEHHPQQALMPGVVYVALDESSMIGFVAGHLTRRYACDGELQWIDVVPERRRTEVASELLRQLATWFGDQKALRFCVNVDPAQHRGATFLCTPRR